MSFNPFGSWEDFQTLVKRGSFAWKNLIGQDRFEPWTPTLQFGGDSTGITYSIQRGRFLTFGRLVYASFRIFLSSNGSATGSASIGALPIAAALNDPISETNSCIGYWSGMTSTLAMISAEPLSTLATLYGVTNAGATSVQALNNGHFSASSQIIGHIFYGRT